MFWSPAAFQECQNHSPKPGTAYIPQWMKIPILASSNHGAIGCVSSDSHVGSYLFAHLALDTALNSTSIVTLAHLTIFILFQSTQSWLDQLDVIDWWIVSRLLLLICFLFRYSLSSYKQVENLHHSLCVYWCSHNRMSVESLYRAYLYNYGMVRFRYDLSHILYDVVECIKWEERERERQRRRTMPGIIPI